MDSEKDGRGRLIRMLASQDTVLGSGVISAEIRCIFESRLQQAASG